MNTSSDLQLLELNNYLAYRNLLYFLRMTGSASTVAVGKVMWEKRP